MSSLLDAGINLKQLQVKEYAELIADINENFSKILNLPGFKGKPGTSTTGDPGDPGARGSIWVFGDLQRFVSAYPEISSAGQINSQFLTNCLNDDAAKLYSVLQVDTLLDNDVIVMPSGIVTQLHTDIEDPNNVGQYLEPQCIDTGITFADSSGVTADEVSQMIDAALGSVVGGVSAIKEWKSYAKNYADTSPGNNLTIEPESMIDIESSKTQPYTQMSDVMFIASRYEQNLNQLCMLTGSVLDYHNIVQNTLVSPGNNWGPGVDDFHALTVLQNSYKNGIIIGYGKTDKDPTLTFRNFARLYRTNTAFRIASSYSPNAYSSGEFTEILMENENLNLNAKLGIYINASKLYGQTADLDLRNFFSTSTDVYLGRTDQGTQNVYIRGTASVQFTNQKSYDFMSTDATGKLVKLLSRVTTLTNNDTDIATSKAVKTVTDSLAQSISSGDAALSNQIDGHTLQLTTMDSNGHFIRTVQDNIDLNSLWEKPGTYIVNKTSAGNVTNSPWTLSNGQTLFINVIKNNQSAVLSQRQLTQTAYFVDTSNTERVATRIATYDVAGYVWRSWSYHLVSKRWSGNINNISISGLYELDTNLGQISGTLPRSYQSSNLHGATLFHKNFDGNSASQELRLYPANTGDIANEQYRTYYRQKNSQSIGWFDWVEMLTTSHLATQTNSWGKVANIGTDGVMEIGKYIDFHDMNANGDYTNRLESSGSGNLTINGQTLWHTGNMGSGSGMNADLWDDIHRPINFGKQFTSVIDGGNVAQVLTVVGSTAYFVRGVGVPDQSSYYSITCISIGMDTSNRRKFMATPLLSNIVYFGYLDNTDTTGNIIWTRQLNIDNSTAVGLKTLSSTDVAGMGNDGFPIKNPDGTVSWLTRTNFSDRLFQDEPEIQLNQPTSGEYTTVIYAIKQSKVVEISGSFTRNTGSNIIIGTLLTAYRPRHDIWFGSQQRATANAVASCKISASTGNITLASSPQITNGLTYDMHITFVTA